MTTQQLKPAESTAGNAGFLGDIRRDDGQKKAIKEIVSFIDEDRYVGDLISMDYDTAEVLIHDRLRKDVGGVPHGCMLLSTRIKSNEDSLNLEDAQTSIILLRVLRNSSLPNDVEMKYARLEAGQRAAQTPDNWDEGHITDQFTLNQMRYSGIHCRILGTFRMNLSDVNDRRWQLEFGGDINNFYAGQGMKVYKPAGEVLERIANYRPHQDAEAPLVEIGRLRYAASIRNTQTPESVPVKIMPEDLIAQRTALFGMTRTGKSNTTKTIASAIFRLRVEKNQRVGQLIFDPNGEYANENPQDQGCIRNVANFHSDLDLTGDVVTYGLQAHPNDPGRNITKFNFFGSNPSSPDAGKEDFDEALYCLYEGKQILNDALRGESAGYIQSFINASVEAPDDVVDKGVNTRFRRALFFYRSILVAAGFTSPDDRVSIKLLFSKDILGVMKKNDEMKGFAEHMDRNEYMTWDMARDFSKQFSKWVRKDDFKKFDRDYKPDRSWSDDRLLGLISIFEYNKGLRVIQGARQWHAHNLNDDYAKKIIDHVRKGKLVIFDQALGAPDMNKQVSARIMRGIFESQQEAFINPETNQETREVEKPPPVIVYVEEAHTLLPEGNESDTTNIWARIAKEGAKFNIGFVYSTQEPSTIQSNILTNTENWFIAHLNNTDEARVISKYNDFADFTDSIIKVNETGFLRVRTLSNPYTLPVQITKFEAPVSPNNNEERTEF